MDPLRVLWAAFAGLIAIAAGTGALAQQWPTRPITVVSPFVSGITDKLVARIHPHRARQEQANRLSWKVVPAATEQSASQRW